MRMLIIIIMVLLMTGCNKIDGYKDITFPNPTANNDEKVDKK